MFKILSISIKDDKAHLTAFEDGEQFTTCFCNNSKWILEISFPEEFSHEPRYWGQNEHGQWFDCDGILADEETKNKILLVIDALTAAQLEHDLLKEK